MTEQTLERRLPGLTGGATTSQKFRYNSIQLALAFVIAAQFVLVFLQPINWDEFYHLSEVHEAYNGTLTQSLQVLYARIFVWLPLLPLDTIDQLRVARLFMFACELFTALAIAGIARKFASPQAAALAALAWISGGYVFRHGFSFRADPIAAALLMGALWLMLVPRLRPLVILGIAALLSVAALATIKIILYAPAFAGVAWLRWREAENRAAVFRAFASIALLTGIGTAMLLALTIASLPPQGEGSTSTVLKASSEAMFSGGFFPKWTYALMQVALAPFLAALVFAAPFDIRKLPFSTDRRLALFGLFLPLFSLLFYRNSFPYFYAFILAPVAVAIAPAVEAVLRQRSARILSALFAVNAAVLVALVPFDVLPRQRAVIAAAHEIFPEPVAYFDFPGMIGDFPQANFFMTVWGIELYQRGERESFTTVMARETVPLLVLNVQYLERNQLDREPSKVLLPEDRLTLRDSFIPHWGPLWVAGKRIPEGEEASRMTIRTPGRYTIEGGAVTIAGTTHEEGAVVQLDRGTFPITGERAAPVTLRWGDHLRRPAKPFDGGEMFMDF